MKAWLRNTKWGWPALALVAAIAVGGVTTGFGSFADVHIPEGRLRELVTAVATLGPEDVTGEALRVQPHEHAVPPARRGGGGPLRRRRGD